VGPEEGQKPLISLNFSWASSDSFPASFRIIASSLLAVFRHHIKLT
jgi:hypothetical protein